jgi:hypothetical protein
MKITHCNVLDHLLDRMLTSVVRHPRKTHWQMSPTNNYHFPVEDKIRVISAKAPIDNNSMLLHLFAVVIAC